MMPAATPKSWSLVIPSPKDPRVMIAAALTLWTVLGQTVYYFNRNPLQLGLCLATACLLDMVIMAFTLRQIVVPISAYITALSVGILLESYDWRIFVITPIWGILSKYLIRDAYRHFFNPSNFAIVAALLLCHGVASVAPGSQWGADYRVAFVIIALGMMMMRRVGRLDLALAWLGGYVIMGLIRMALGQGGLVFVLGPLTGAEFALFTFSMLPDPKTSPPTRRGRIAWGFSIAIIDGILRYYEIRYSMFYALFAHCAILPIIRWAATRAGVKETEAWKFFTIPLRRAHDTPSFGPVSSASVVSAALPEPKVSQL